jgi:hypothetical protein
MPIATKVIYRFNAILTKILAGFYVSIDKILKIIWKVKITTWIKQFFKKNKVIEIMLPNNKIYYKEVKNV